MDREELKQYLPHREPMLLVDEAEIDSEGVTHARYLIREDEFFCQGHFPGNPLVPGVIQCEIMAQSCALLMKDEIVGKTTLYSGIDNVRFKNPVRPGLFLLTGFSCAFYCRHSHFIDHRAFCCHEVQDSCCKREECGERERHLVHVAEYVYPDPYLETECKKTGYDADACLKEECLETSRSRYMSCHQHYQEDKIWKLLPVCYGRFRSVRTYDGREYAEEHGEDERCRYSEI